MKIKRDEVPKALKDSIQMLDLCCRDKDDFRIHAKLKYGGKLPAGASYLMPLGWPQMPLLVTIRDAVFALAHQFRKKTPSPPWKAFLLVDKHYRELRLVQKINDLWNRAMEAMAKVHEKDDLEKAARFPDATETEMLFRDLQLDKDKFARLLDEHDRRVKERVLAYHWVEWTLLMGYPNHISVLPSGETITAFQMIRILDAYPRQLEKNRERQKRHRQRKNSLPEKRYTTPL
jgi:hypothetical protein